jgi:acyl-[acyl-carrier-protein] desaturase
MSRPLDITNPNLRVGMYRLYREFFSLAERNRRWSIDTDIPWDQCNRSMDPAIADIVESFCAVELYLPDYVAKAIPMIRANKGWAWIHINWGYEESKHSLVLGDWLLRSGLRTEEQMADMEDRLFAHEWNLPQDSPQGMLIYAMVQELATFLHYRNLKRHVDKIGDPALSKVLKLICVDERAHHAFYRQVVQMFIEMDRDETIEQLRRVTQTFGMPAVHLLAETRDRVASIRELQIFDEEIFLREVYQPILEVLGIQRSEMRVRRPNRKSAPIVDSIAQG